MFKIILVISVCFGILAIAELIRTATAGASDRLPADYYKVNNIPKAEEGCVIKFDCKKKLKHTEIPRPCVKFCVKSIECENGKKSAGAPNQCLELNEETVMQEYNDCKKDEVLHIMPVAMIDFPCQPGYLPDSRGRCREVW